MPKFTLHHPAFVTTTSLKTIAKLTTVTPVTIELVFLSLTGAGSVAPNVTDLQHEFGASYLSASIAGTLTAYTPELADPTSAAARATYGVNATVEPTVYATNPFLFGGFNQRSGYAWGVPERQGFTAQPTVAAKQHMGIRLRSSLAHVVDFNAHVIEP